MNPDFALKTWTVYFDYGNAPLIWERDGLAVGPGVGMLCLHASEMNEIVPDPMGKEFDDLGCTWESSIPDEIDWLFFHQEAMRLSALLALWVAQFNIMIRYSPPYEDGRFRAYNSELWMDPGTVARLARGLPSLQDDSESWNALLMLYGVGDLNSLLLSDDAPTCPTIGTPDQGCAPS